MNDFWLFFFFWSFTSLWFFVINFSLRVRFLQISCWIFAFTAWSSRFRWHVKSRVVFCDSLADEQQLTKEPTNYTGHMFVLLSVTINIDDVLEINSFFDFTLLDKFIIDVFLKPGKLFSASCCLFISLTLGFGRNSCLIFFFSDFGGIISCLVVIVDRVSVLLGNRLNKVNFDLVRQLTMLVKLLQIRFSFIE